MNDLPLSGDDAALRALYARRDNAAAAGACASPESIEALVDGTGAESTRLRTLDHVMTCAECQVEFELLRSANVAEQEISGARGHRRVPLALAAALVITVAAAALWRASSAPPPADTLRGAGPAVVLVTPSDDARLQTGDGERFVWRATADATTYNLELLSDDGSAVTTIATTDTTHVLADTVLARATRATQWRVEARLADGSRFSSPLRRLRITP